MSAIESRPGAVKLAPLVIEEKLCRPGSFNTADERKNMGPEMRGGERGGCLLSAKDRLAFPPYTPVFYD